MFAQARTTLASLLIMQLVRERKEGLEQQELAEARARLREKDQLLERVRAQRSVCVCACVFLCIPSSFELQFPFIQR